MQKILTGILVLCSVFSTVWFVTQAKPSSLTAFIVLTGWMLLPYVLMVIQTVKSRHPSINLGSVLVALILANWALVDIFFIHPDPQGAIAMFMVSPMQVVLYEIVYAIGRGLSKKVDASVV